MSSENIERLEIIIEKIDAIFKICQDDIWKALDDNILGRPAILMHLVVCNKQIQKMQDSGDNILEVLMADDIRGIRGVRNAIAYNYDGIDLYTIEKIIAEYLPNMRDNIENYLTHNQSLRSNYEQH